jgi:multidrug efflux system membrane fusion protein
MPRHHLLPVLLLSAAAAGCGAAGGPPPAPKPAEVVVSRAFERGVTDYEEFQGKTDAVKSVDVRAHVSGYLDRYDFIDGAEVTKGDVLFEIDPRPFKAELARADANVVLADAHVKRLQYDFERAQTLLSKGSISREDYDKASGDLDEARATVKSVKAARDAAELNVTYSRVIAPISGRISRRLVDPGNMVKADDTMLTRIVSLDPIYAYFDIDERTFLRIERFYEKQGGSADGRKNAPVEMGLSDEQGFPRAGTIDFTDNRVDPDSGSVWLRGVFPNPNKFLTPGLFVRVRLPVGQAHTATLIPEQALATDQGQKFVWVVDDKADAEGKNKATYRRIHLGAQHGSLRVVTEGIKPGERVIVSGLQRVRNDPKTGHAEVKVLYDHDTIVLAATSLAQPW